MKETDMTRFQTISTATAPPKDQADVWAAAIAERFGGLRIDTFRRGDFDGTITHSSTDDIQICRLSAQAHRAANAPRSSAQRQRSYKIAMQLAGHSEFEQDGLKARLSPGDWAIYDTSRPYLMTASDAVDLAIVVLPQHLVPLRPAERHVLVRTLDGRTGAGRMVRNRLLDALNGAEQNDELNDELNDEPSAGLTRMLRLAIAENLECASQRPLPTVLRTRIVDYVRQHLAEPDLTVEQIARGLNCSKRYLHRVFDTDASTLAKYIMQLRLTTICGDFGNPLLRERSITEIAMKWGFVSPGHFSRTFKEAFGVTPREYRANVLNGLQPRPLD
jgi:AraC-like DNA-binding protein